MRVLGEGCGRFADRRFADK